VVNEKFRFNFVNSDQFIIRMHCTMHSTILMNVKSVVLENVSFPLSIDPFSAESDTKLQKDSV